MLKVLIDRRREDRFLVDADLSSVVYRRLTVLCACIITVSLLCVAGGTALADEQGEIPPHEHPDEIGDGGDLDAIAEWLRAYMSGSLDESAVDIGESEFDLAREALGDDYGARLSQYQSLAEEVDLDRTEETFAETRDTQRNYTDNVEEFEDLLEEYEEALEAGDEEQARSIAEELDALGEEIGELSDELLDRYEELEEWDDIDLSEARRSTEQRNETIQSDRDDAVASLTETRISISVKDEGISFTDPANVSGKVINADGESVSDTRVRIELGPDVVETHTNASGAYATDLRPTMAPMETETIEAHHAPEAGSGFRESVANASVDIQQVTPNIEIVEFPSTIAFGENATIEGHIAVDGVPIDGVDLSLVVGDSTVPITSNDGRIEGTFTVPANASAEHGFILKVTEEGRAIAPAETVVETDVRETPTELSLETVEDEQQLVATGTLETDDDTGIPGQSVAIAVDGSMVGVAETDEHGEYRKNATIPEVEEDDEVEVVATFDGEGTSLAGSEAEATLVWTGSGLPVSRSILGVVAFVGVLLVVVMALAKRRGYLPSAVSFFTGPGEQSGEERRERPNEASDQQAVGDLLSIADELQSQHPSRAVEIGYTAVRNHLGDEPSDRSLTHWEFCNRRVESEAALFDLTEMYERAVFSPSGVDREEARNAVALARSLADTT